jgi:hypothetical protein
LSTLAIRKKTAWLVRYVGKRYADIVERYKTNPPRKFRCNYVYGDSGDREEEQITMITCLLYAMDTFKCQCFTNNKPECR